jgi:RsiW-degrading membrane proteinase PrsW (M82 family)
VTALLIATFVVALVPIFTAAALHRILLQRSILRSEGAPEAQLVGARRARRLFATSTLLGAAGGTIFGLWVAPVLDEVFAAWEPTLGLAFVRFAVAGPLAEELGKGLLLLGLALVGRVRGVTAAILLGIAAGAGFAAVENFVYAIVSLGENGPSGWWDSIRIRIGLGTFVHAASTATLGAYLGAAAASRSVLLKLAAPFAAVFAASVVHGVWNGLIMMVDVTRQPTWAFAALFWLAGVMAALAITIALDLRRARLGRSDPREQVT